MGCGGSSAAADARKQEEQRQAQVKAAVGNINQTFSGFDDKFYNQRAQAYQQFALPQLGDQFRQTQGQLVYKLANQGLLNSSAARTLQNSLTKETQMQQRGLAAQGIGQANQLRQNVENQRNLLISEAQSATDPSSIATSALSNAASLQAPSTFAPVTNLLQNWTQLHLAQQLASAYNQPYTSYQQPKSYMATSPVSVGVH